MSENSNQSVAVATQQSSLLAVSKGELKPPFPRASVAVTHTNGITTHRESWNMFIRVGIGVIYNL